MTRVRFTVRRSKHRKVGVSTGKQFVVGTIEVCIPEYTNLLRTCSISIKRLFHEDDDRKVFGSNLTTTALLFLEKALCSVFSAGRILTSSKPVKSRPRGTLKLENSEACLDNY